MLIIQLERDSDIEVGALGRLHFSKGFYAYVGSAQKSLETRIARHFKREKKRFWHIDYFLGTSSCKIIETLILDGDKNCECIIARAIYTMGEPVVGFGCSDCNCRSHLVRLKAQEFLHEIILQFRPRRLDKLGHSENYLSNSQLKC